MNQYAWRSRFIVAANCAAALTALLWANASGFASADPTVIRASRVIECGVGDEARPAVVSGIAITADGRTVAAATDDHRVRFWDADTGELKEHYEAHSDWVRAAALSADGRYLASGAGDRSLCLCEVGGHSSPVQLPVGDAVAAVSFHPNSQQLAVVGFGSSLKIVNTSTGQVSQELQCPCRDIRTVAFSRDGERMAVAGRNGKIRIWDVSNGARERDIITDGRRIRALSFSPDGRWLAAAGNSSAIRIFDVASGEEAITLNTRPAKVFALVFVNDNQLATGGSDNRIQIWNLESRQATKQLVGHTGTVTALACNGSGNILVSGSYDTTLRIWNLDSQNSATATRQPATATR